MMMMISQDEEEDASPTTLCTMTLTPKKRHHSEQEQLQGDDSLAGHESSSPFKCNRHDEDVLYRSSQNKNKRQKHGYTVHFCEEDNEYHEAISTDTATTTPCNHEKDESSVSSLWFSKDELLRFRRDTIAMARRLIAAAQQSNQAQQDNCVQTLEHVYQQFCHINTTSSTNDDDDEEEEDVTLRHVQPLLPPNHMSNAFGRATILGMEKWVVRIAGKERLARRQALHRMVLQQQQQHDHRLEQHSLRAKCRTLSRPVRLWAHYMALIVAQSQE